jgi:hypothetical protein
MNAFGSPNGLSDFCSDRRGPCKMFHRSCVFTNRLLCYDFHFVCNKFDLSIYENLQKWMNPEDIT